MKNVFWILCLALFSISLQSCGGGGGTATNNTPPVTAAQGITSAAAVSVVTAK